MKKIISILVLFFLFNSCSVDSGSNYLYEVLPTESVDIPAEFTLGGIYPITIRYNRPTSCHYFNGLYYKKHENKRTIAVESAVEQRDNCQDLNAAAAADEYTFNFEVTSNGTYHFKFWQGKDDQGNDIFLEYEVPVN
jgi:hypothetical protein